MNIASGKDFLINYFPIHIIGDTSLAKGVFNTLGMIFGHFGKHTFLTTAITIAMLFCIVVMVYRFVTFRMSLSGMLFNIVASLVLVLGFAITTSVKIIDGRTSLGQAVVGGQSQVNVDNVPYMIAFVASLGSYIGYELVRYLEPIFVLEPNSPTYTEFGFTKHLQYTFSKTQVFSSNGPAVEWSSLYENYIRECAYPYGNNIDKKNISEQVTLAGINPANMSSRIVASSTTSGGRNCQDLYNDLINAWNGVSDEVRKSLIRGVGLDENTIGRASAFAPFTYQILKDEATGYDDFTNYLLHPFLQDRANNAKISASMGVGSGISGSASIANAEAYMAKRRVDGSSLATWLVANEYVEIGTNFILLLSYIIFPFVMFIALASVLEKKIMILRNYFGGILVLNLMPLSLMIVHTFTISQLNSNITEKLLNGNANGTPYLNAEYYSELGNMASVSTILGAFIALVLPAVILTGGVDKLMSMLGRLIPSNVGDVSSYMQESSNAKANQLTAMSVGETAGSFTETQMLAQTMKNSSTQLGEWQQMDSQSGHRGRSFFMESEKESQKLNALSKAVSDAELGSYVASGRFEGGKYAGSGIAIGNVMQKGHSWSDTDGSFYASGSQIAKGVGSIAGASAVSSGIAGAESRILDSSGKLGGKEGSEYMAGLIGGQRIQQNQTIGVGKEGTFTLGEMTNVQRVSASSIQAQIQQGEALKREYGIGGSNPLLGDGYAKDVLTTSQDKWKQAKAQGSKLRELFGDNLDKNYQDMSRDETLSQNMDMKLKTEVGTASAYKKAKEEYGNNIATDSAEVSTYSKMSSVPKEIERRKEAEKEKLGDNYDTLKNQTAQQMLNKNSTALADLDKSAGEAVLETIKNAKGNNLIDKAINSIDAIKEIQQKYQNAHDDLTKPNMSSKEDFIKYNSSSTDTIKYQLGEDFATASAIQMGQTSAMVQGYKDMGVANSNGLTSVGYTGSVINSIEQAKGLLNNVATYGNTSAMDAFAGDNLSSSQRQMLNNASNVLERAKLFNLMTTGKTLQGFIGDKQFNVGFGGAGTTSSYMGTINSQISRSMGFVSSGGNGFDAMAYGAGGMTAMEGMAVASTAVNTLKTSFNTISQFGRVGRAVGGLRGVMGGGENAISPVSQVDVGMSNITASESFARKGAMDSISNISRRIGVHQQYGNLPSNSLGWGRMPNGGVGNGGKPY